MATAQVSDFPTYQELGRAEIVVTSSVMTKLIGILLIILVVVFVADRFGALGLFYSTGAVATIVSVAWVVGALLPAEAVGPIVVRAAEFHQSPEVVWQSLIDYERFPTWRRDLRSVTPLAAHEGRPRWRELFVTDYPLPAWVEIEEMVENKKLVTRVLRSPWPTTRMQPPRRAFLAGAFLTRWTYDISCTPIGALLRVTQCCTEDNPFGKFLAYILRWRGCPMTMTNHLLDLGKKFGEGVNVVGS